MRHSRIEVNYLHPAVILDAVCDARSSVRGPAALDGPSQQRDVSTEQIFCVQQQQQQLLSTETDC